MIQRLCSLLTAFALMWNPAEAAGKTPSPAPSAPERPAAPAVRLTQLQFADSAHGWVAGSIGDDPTTQIWRTSDGGKRWASAPIESGLQDAVFSFADGKHGWAIGSSECNMAAGTALCGRTTILHTSDGGKTWKGQWSIADRRAGANNEIQAIDENTAFVRVRSAIGKTTDGGQTWLDASVSDSGEAAPYRISFVDALTGYAAGGLGTECPDPGLVPSDANADCRAAVWKTKDGGRHWVKLANAPRLSGDWSPAAIRFPDRKHGFVLFVNPDTHGSLLYATDNGGGKWKLRNDKIPGIRPYPVKLEFVNPRVGYVPLSVGAGPVEGGLLKTVNGGTHFAKLQDPRLVSVQDADFHDPRTGWIIALNPERPESALLLGTKDGGGSWTDFTPGT